MGLFRVTDRFVQLFALLVFIPGTLFLACVLVRPAGILALAVFYVGLYLFWRAFRVRDDSPGPNDDTT
jgi:hypothetical protein